MYINILLRRNVYIFFSPGAGATSPASGSGTQLKEKVLKMSALIDQQDESELVPVPNSTLNKWTQV